MNHFLRPRNVGVLEGGARGEATNTDCGDTVLLTLRAEGERVAEARFQSTGCAGALACCSAVTEILQGLTLAEARELSAQAILDFLGGLPEEKHGCARMAAEAARAAAARA